MNHSYELLVTKPVIAASDLELLSSHRRTFEKLPGTNGITLLIRATVELTDIDPAWTAYLFLMSRSLGPRLEIILKLQENYEFSGNTGLLIRLKQLLVHGQLFLGRLPFNIEAKDGKVDMPRDHFRPGSFVLSRRFSVPLFIDRALPEVFELLFLHPPADFTTSLTTESELGIAAGTDTKKMEAAINELFRERCRPGNPVDGLKNLGRLAFYRVLILTWTLNVYRDELRRHDPEKISKNCRAGYLGSAKTPGKINALEYFKLLEPVISELSQKPLIYSFMFNLLLSREILPTELNSGNARGFAEDLQKRWSFCRELASGLIELAKNIEEHSSGHFGIITARIASNKEGADGGESEDGLLYLHLLPSLPDGGKDIRPRAILEIQVTDLGIEGIVPRLLKNLEEKSEEHGTHPVLKELYQKDITRIRSGEIGVQQLLKTRHESPLMHQTKRAVAHLGLLKFSKLIEDNGGALIVISNDGNNGRETARVPQTAPLLFPELHEETIFRFCLPVREGKLLRGMELGRLSTNTEGSRQQMLGLEALMDFKVLSGTLSYVAGEWVNEKLLMTHTPEPFLFSGHNVIELWQKLDDFFNKHRFVLEDPENKLFHLDLKHIRFDFSSLFRLLGYWELHYPENSLLVSNIPQVLLEELIATNISYKKQNPGVHFWNESSPVIIFSYVELPRPGGSRFYFTDALWGKETCDFYRMNRLIHSFHYNSVTWLKSGQRAATPEEGGEMHWPRVLFNRHYHLLPFDLLLEQEDGRNLFEINTSFTLQNDLQPAYIFPTNTHSPGHESTGQ